MKDTTARTMATREFLHGGYREREGAVIVLSGGEVAGVWFPGTAAITAAPPQLFARAPESSITTPLTPEQEAERAAFVATLPKGPDIRPAHRIDDGPRLAPRTIAAAFRPAPKPGAAAKKPRGRR